MQEAVAADRADVHGPAATNSTFSGRANLAVGTAAIFAPLNSSMLAVALPAIRREFDVGVAAATWLVSAYLVAVAVSQPIGGRIGDALGHLRVMKAGLIALLALSVCAALAPSYPALVALRALQGVSAAIVMPNATAYLRRVVPGERLAGALGTNGAIIGAGAAFGPVVGGLVLGPGTWHWLFWLNVPLVAASLLFLSRLQPDGGNGRRPDLDLVSIVALALAFTGMSLAGTALRFRAAWLLGAATFSVVSGLLVYIVRYLRARRGVVDLGLFSRRNYAAAASGTALANLVMYTTLVAMPVYLEDIRGRSTVEVGFILFAIGGPMVLVAPFAGRLADVVGSRPLLSGGGLLLLAGAGGLAFALRGASLSMVVALLVMIGFGMALIGGPQQAAALKSWPRDRAGSASGTYSFMRYVGSVAGTALLAAMIPKGAVASDFALLLVPVAVVAAANLVACLSVRKVDLVGT